MQVAKTVDINHVSPLLAQLGAYDGMVTLALAKAKALDPEVVAAQKSEAGRLAREVICCRAYGYSSCICMVHCICSSLFASVTMQVHVQATAYKRQSHNMPESAVDVAAA